MTAALADWFADNITTTSAAQFDWINIMSYDAYGSWSGPGQHSPYSLAVNDFNYWKNTKGVPASKLVIGVPFYGYGWGTYGQNGSGNYLAYSTILNTYGGSANSDQVGSGNNVIYYNGIPTIKSKANYVLQQNAGGIMIWELSQDVSDNRSLLNAIYEVLGTSTPPVPQGPYNGVRMNIPGKVEVENYDVGGSGVAYSDNSAGNQGGVYRTDDVDIQATTDAGAGYNVGWMADNEWMEYSVNIASAGAYNFEFRTASTSGGALRLELDGTDLTGTVNLPNTGDWQTWASTSRSNITLPAGQHILKVYVVTGNFNLNYVNFTTHVNQAPTASITAPANNASFTSPATVTISANASDADGTISKVEFFNGATKLGEATSAPYNYTWSNIAAGTYSITAKATDNNAATATSTAVSISVTNPVSNCPNLTWSDDFNGTSLDQSKWNYQTGDGCPGNCGWGNNELEYYTSNSGNVSVSGGNLALTALYQPNYNGSGKNYTSGKLVTSGKFSQKYGRYEARIKVPSAAGIWPAFWMLADNTAWPGTGEIDILECLNTNPTTWYGTLHYASTSGVHQSMGSTWNSPVPLSNDFHIYACEWTTDHISWYIDGVLRGTVTKAAAVAGGGAWPFDNQKFFIILNLAVGGNFPGQNPISSQYPQTMLVDYVRVYSGDPCTVQQSPYNGTAVSIPGTIQAENYDLGGQDVAYNDSETANQGGAYRTDGVDIEATTDTDGGYNVGWTATGEWLEYTVNVTATANYAIAFRTAGTSTATLHLEVDGNNVTGDVALPNTGGWQTWATTTKTNVSLSAGQHVLRVYEATGGFNLNYIKVTASATGPVNQLPSVSITSPANNATYTAGASITINANASDADGTVSKVEFFNGGTKLGEDLTSPYSFSWANVAAGSYTITVRATDNSGGATTSSGISVTVMAVTNTCSGVPQYIENGGYVAGSRVQVGGTLYECKPYPYSGWCNGAAWAYGPGTGTYWSDAWTNVGNCTAAKLGVASEPTSTGYVETGVRGIPNPFNAATKVEVTIASGGEVLLEVYDNKGVKIKELYKGYLDAGTYSYDFDSNGSQSELYLLKLTSNDQVYTRKLLKLN